MDYSLDKWTGGKADGRGKGTRGEGGSQYKPAPVQSSGKVALTRTSCSAQRAGWAACGAAAALSCAELIIENEKAWKCISSHTEALLTTQSEDRGFICSTSVLTHRLQTRPQRQSRKRRGVLKRLSL